MWVPEKFPSFCRNLDHFKTNHRTWVRCQKRACDSNLGCPWIQKRLVRDDLPALPPTLRYRGWLEWILEHGTSASNIVFLQLTTAFLVSCYSVQQRSTLVQSSTKRKSQDQFYLRVASRLGIIFMNDMAQNTVRPSVVRKCYLFIGWPWHEVTCYYLLTDNHQQIGPGRKFTSESITNCEDPDIQPNYIAVIDIHIFVCGQKPNPRPIFFYHIDVIAIHMCALGDDPNPVCSNNMNNFPDNHLHWPAQLWPTLTDAANYLTQRIAPQSCELRCIGSTYPTLSSSSLKKISADINETLTKHMTFLH